MSYDFEDYTAVSKRLDDFEQYLTKENLTSPVGTHEYTHFFVDEGEAVVITDENGEYVGSIRWVFNHSRDLAINFIDNPAPLIKFIKEELGFNSFFAPARYDFERHDYVEENVDIVRRGGKECCFWNHKNIEGFQKTTKYYVVVNEDEDYIPKEELEDMPARSPESFNITDLVSDW